MSEEVHPRADELDTLSTLELVTIMHSEDANAVAAMAPHLGDMARAVDATADRLRSGGRLHYFGAGTSGLIAAMDAAECPATFGVAEDAVQAHAALERGEEDDRGAGQNAAREAALRPSDVVVGISASGRTAYVLGALEEATDRGTLTIAITCNPRSRMTHGVDIAIEIPTGPEVIAGSTRLKAGTVQKLVLNTLSTGVFTRLGHTYRGRMVAVVAGNEKLRARAARIVADLGGMTVDEARRRLAEAGGDVRAVLAAVRHT